MTLYTPKFGIPYGWGVGEDPGALQASHLRQLIDSGIPAAFGQNPYGTSGLVYAWFGGNIPSGFVTAIVAGGSLALAPGATSYIERTVGGVVSVNTTGFTNDGSKIPMAKVTTSATEITAIEDWRPSSALGGGGGSWGSITGTLSAQADLQAALDAKSAATHNHAGVYEPLISPGTATQVWRGDKTWGFHAYSDLTGIPSTFAPSAHAHTHAPGGVDAIPWTTVLGRGTTASKPAAAAGNAGFLYFDTDLGKLQRSNGSAWQDIAETVGAGSVAWGSITGALGSQTDIATALAGKEPGLGNPATDNYGLVSTVAGVRSWVAIPSTANMVTSTVNAANQVAFFTAARVIASAAWFTITAGQYQVGVANGGSAAFMRPGLVAASSAGAATQAYFENLTGARIDITCQPSTGDIYTYTNHPLRLGANYTLHWRIDTNGTLYQITAQGIQLASGTPTSTTTKIYQVSGELRWDGKVVNLVTPRVQSIASGDLTPNADANDLCIITAAAAAFTLVNPSGTPAQGQKLVVRIKDNGTARAISYGTYYRAVGTVLPTTTILSKTLYLGLIYNSTDTKWDVVAVSQE